MRSLHLEALCWLRYGKQLPIIATEAGGWQADVIGMNTKTVVEVEVKKSISDLRAEFKNKPAKHHTYDVAETFDPRSRSGYIPNYFYVLVDREIADKALEIIQEKMPKAGLAVRTMNGVVEVKKRAGKLHGRPPSPGFIDAAIRRMASEICISRIAIEDYQPNVSTEDVCKVITEEARRIEGTLDFEDPLPGIEIRGAQLALVMTKKQWKDIPDAERVDWIGKANNLRQLQPQLEGLIL